MISWFRSRKKRQFKPTDTLPHVEAPAGEEPVELRDLKIQARVSGLLAETTQTMRFYNPNRRDLEGTITFPLPDGATVCGYALDVDGELVDGVVVPKQEARRILEAEERKGVDPGLVEQVQGNIYRTRVYPIPARGSRTVQVTYVSDLTVEGDEAAYHLPLSHAAQIERVDLRVEVLQAPVQPRLSGGLGNLTLNRWEDRWVAEARLGRGTPAEDLQVRLPALPPQFCTLERGPDGEVFFCVSGRLDHAAPEPWAPARLAVAWDASGSRADGVARDLELLQGLLSAWPQLVLDLVVFRDRVEARHHTFSAGQGDEDEGELLAFLGGLPYDGGTNLADLDLATTPHPDDEAWLLFSDGLGTVARGLPEVAGTPVYTVASQASCDSALLQRVAHSSGGRYLNLLRTGGASRAVEQLGSAAAAPRVGEAAGCEDWTLSSGGGRLEVTGRLTADQGQVTLVGPGAPDRGFPLDAAQATPGNIIARAWAGEKAQTIALTSEESAEELVELGRRYGLVTPGTSLLVLESLEQYLEYGIEPPATLPRMRQAYLRDLASTALEKERKEGKQIDGVLELWRRRIQWWERDYISEYLRKQSRDKARKLAAPAPPMRARHAAPPPPQAMPSPSMASPPPQMPSMAPPAMAPQAAAPPEAMELRSMEQEDCMDAECDAVLCDEPMGAMADAKKKADAPAGARAAISIKPWSPDTPYLSAMREAGPEGAYAAYLTRRVEYAASPAFFMDCGDHLLGLEQQELGVRVLSNLPELGLDDPALARMYAWRLQQAGELDLAVRVLSRVRRQREDEPQSHRDLALALGQRWERDGDPEDAARAMELLYEVVLRAWDRFPQIEVIALMELNRLIHQADAAGAPIPGQIDPRLRRHLDLDLRISMSWDADLTDVDLHVFEPSGEHAYYGHNLTETGGLVSLDFREGYGPEEYVLHRALPGTYIIKAHYYGSSQQNLTGPCTVTATVFTNYGRPDEQKQVLMLRLDRPSDQVLVGEVEVDAGSGAADPAANAGDDDWRPRFAGLRKGMTLNEVTAAVGQPAELRGEAQMLLIYRPAPDVELQLTVGPRLEAVQQVMDGATLDLL